MEKLRTGAVGVSGDLARSGEDSRGPSLAEDWNGCMVDLWTMELCYTEVAGVKDEAIHVSSSMKGHNAFPKLHQELKILAR